MSYTHIDPGKEIEVVVRTYYDTDKSRVAELVKAPLRELEQREAASVEKEKTVFAKFSALEAEWLVQARETVALRKASQHLKTPPVKHTSNQWVAGEYDWHEMSKMVYKFSWHVYENTCWDRKQQKSVPTSWEISWYITYNTPRTSDYTGPGNKIAGQERKRFGTKEALDKYLQGRIKAYAHLFAEISPAIPEEQYRRFCVNGVLLPGYTVEPTREQTVDELLEVLGEDDFVEHGREVMPAEPISTPDKEKPPGKAASAKKRHAPTR